MLLISAAILPDEVMKQIFSNFLRKKHDKYELWTTKHAPQNINELVGNRAPIERMQNWLKNW